MRCFQRREFPFSFLHAVFAKEQLAGSDYSFDRFGAVSFADGDEMNGIGFATCTLGCAGHAAPYQGQAFG